MHVLVTIYLWTTVEGRLTGSLIHKDVGMATNVNEAPQFYGQKGHEQINDCMLFYFQFYFIHV